MTPTVVSLWEYQLDSLSKPQRSRRGDPLPVVEEMMDTGLMAVSEVRVVRVQKKVAAHEGKGA